MKRILFILLFPVFTALSFAQSTNDHSGYVDLNYMARLSDNSLINIPYRIFNINVDHQNGDLSIKSTLALEHQLRSDTYFLTNSSPQDFHWDLRELYMQWFTSFGEIRVGKQIHTWGSTDENSPIDVVNPLDYYYLFSTGAERKLGTFSIASDIYWKNLKLGFVFSPLHNTHRTPSGDNNFPIKLPITPQEYQIFPLHDQPFEGGFYTVSSRNFGEISYYYFSGYDRLFNFTGVSTYSHIDNSSFVQVELVYGFRKTQALGMGAILLNDLFTIRADMGLFDTRDQNSSISRELAGVAFGFNNYIFVDSLSFPMEEKARYYQSTFQIEVELPADINFIGQIFIYDTLYYSSNDFPVDQEINIPNLEINPDNFTPADFFTPGIGAPMAVLSKKLAFFSLKRDFLDSQLNINLTAMLDLDKTGYKGTVPGALYSFQTEYNLLEDLKAILGITKIIGADGHPDGDQYRFNQMEDFSHMRLELKYFF